MRFFQNILGEDYRFYNEQAEEMKSWYNRETSQSTTYQHHNQQHHNLS